MTNEVIISKLDKFIRKYYKNKLIKGILYCVFLLLSFFLILNTLEYFGYYSTLTRSILYYYFLAVSLLIIYFFIIVPLFKLFRLTKTISYKEAANIIGTHFPEVSDKLLNLLQLQDIASKEDSELLEASIKQRTNELTPIPFVKAIDISKNRKYIKWTLIPVLIIILSGIFFPSFISEPTYRYINHSKHFQKPAPFSFTLLNKELKVLQHGDIDIKVRIEGEVHVDKVNIVINKQIFQMNKEKKDVFSYSIKQIQNKTSFHFESSGITSKDYNIEVNPKPILLDLQAVITYPSYTQKPQETLTNVSNFSVPKGSTINWRAITRDTRTLIFKSNQKEESYSPDKNGRLSFSKRIMSDFSYQISTKNNFTTFSDSLEFRINAIPDLSPQIAVIEQKDSLIADRVYFRGQIKDDYGFSKLEFHIEKYEKDVQEPTHITSSLPLNTKENTQEFYYSYDLSELKAGERVVYYFEVWDNDAIDGAKSTRSGIFTIEIPTIDEIEEKQEKTSSQIKKETDQSLMELKKIQEEIRELNKKMLEKKELDWQDKKQVEALKKKQEQIKQSLEEISKKIKENNNLDQRYKPQNEEILRKQKELEKLYEEVAKDMFEELNKLMKDNVKKEELKEALDKMKMSNENLEKQLDRNLEMFKRLEVDKKMQETIDKLNKAAQEQKELSEQTEKNPKNNQDIQEKQSQLNKSFEDIKKDIQELQKKASELEDPFQIKRDKQKEDSISQAQSNAQKKMEQRKNRDASKEQKQAAQQMQEMADDLEKQQQDNEEEQLAEDIQEVRQIIKNLIKLSFMQEDLILKVRETSVTDPLYQNLINTQNRIKNDMEMISDSLFAMSKRQPQISNIINKELTSIDNQIGISIEKLLQYNQGIYGSYKNTQATTSQQYAMTSMNNLSLLLAESLNNMQQEMKSKSDKSCNSKSQPKNQCNNPKAGKKNPKTMRELQEALNKEMERLKKELENQKKGQEGKPRIGENAKINEELAKMAAQQEMIRKMMQQYSNELKEEGGKSAGELDNLMKQMEQTETDIVNKIINQQTINRQNNIITRMLQHEKAQQKQEQEQRRESTEGRDLIENTNNQFLEFNKLKNRELELFKQVPPVFSPYYKEKVNEFFNKFER
ncbi:MAG: DUF4175 family protein [Bacteroidales bacterium]|nr:DUF4175 family protein [Bacteroidales bacterium]MDD4703833.1 DUF4175 family protein [Bacteroidales bacterium]